MYVAAGLATAVVTGYAAATADLALAAEMFVVADFVVVVAVSNFLG